VPFLYRDPTGLCLFGPQSAHESPRPRDDRCVSIESDSGSEFQDCGGAGEGEGDGCWREDGADDCRSLGFDGLFRTVLGRFTVFNFICFLIVRCLAFVR